MYQIYADDTLIYDSTIDDYKIGVGTASLEVDKSGSFVFGLYKNHFYYDQIIKMRTIITVYKSGKIVFRGRALDEVTDYWDYKQITCEGERGFLQDSIARPFDWQGDHGGLFGKFITDHNAQVDDYKRFNVGTVTVVDSNQYINRSSADYSPTLPTMESALTGSALGGHFVITHGDDGTDPTPTIHYLADFTAEASQSIDFGVNLKNYVKTADAKNVATAIIPLGAQMEGTGQRLTIADVNGGLDYVTNAAALAARGWICKTVVWDDVTIAQNLKTKALAYLDTVINQNVTVELTAIDMHLFDRSIDSFRVGDNIHVKSEPHNLDAVMLCTKQTFDLLRPENDTVTLGYPKTTFTAVSNSTAASVSTLGKTVSSIQHDGKSIALKVQNLEGREATLTQEVQDQGAEIALIVQDGNVKGAAIISAINGESVATIDASRINLNGYVTVNSLANGTTTVDGGCLKAATVTADAIVGNTITAAELAANCIGTDELRASVSIYSPSIYGGEIYAGTDDDDGSHAKMTESGYEIYISEEMKARLGQISGWSDWDMVNQALMLGSDNPGVIVKYHDGSHHVWIGDIDRTIGIDLNLTTETGTLVGYWPQLEKE